MKSISSVNQANLTSEQNCYVTTIYYSIELRKIEKIACGDWCQEK